MQYDLLGDTTHSWGMWGLVCSRSPEAGLSESESPVLGYSHCLVPPKQEHRVRGVQEESPCFSLLLPLDNPQGFPQAKPPESQGTRELGQCSSLSSSRATTVSGPGAEAQGGQPTVRPGLISFCAFLGRA